MTERNPRLSLQSLKVLKLLLEHPTEALAGSDICRTSGMLSGTLYPILLRFEKAGWLESKWEELEPSEAGRPRKRFYRLTGIGHSRSRSALSELVVDEGRFAWTS